MRGARRRRAPLHLRRLQVSRRGSGVPLVTAKELERARLARAIPNSGDRAGADEAIPKRGDHEAVMDPVRRVDPKQRCRRVIYELVARYLEALADPLRAPGNDHFVMPELAELVRLADKQVEYRKFWTTHGNMRAELLFVAEELRRRARGRGHYRRRRRGPSA